MICLFLCCKETSVRVMNIIMKQLTEGSFQQRQPQIVANSGAILADSGAIVGNSGAIVAQ